MVHETTAHVPSKPLARPGRAPRSSPALRGVVTLSWVTMALLVAALTSTPEAWALPGDIGKKFQVNDEDPLSNLPSMEDRNQSPIEFAHYLQDLIARAELALEDRNYEQAVKYHEALARLVPDRAITFSRLCVDYGRLNKPELAAVNCATAIRLGGAKVIDHVRFINFTLQKAQVTPTDVTDIEASLAHMRDHAAKNPQPLPENRGPASSASASVASASASSAALKPKLSKEEAIALFMAKREARLEQAEEQKNGKLPKLNPMHLPTEIEVLDCKLASQLGDATRLTRCMNKLRSYQANEKLLLPFAWAQALIQKDMGKAEDLLEQAKQLGVTESTLAAMEREQDAAFASKRQIRWAVGLLAALAVALGGVLGVRHLSNRRPNVPAEA